MDEVNDIIERLYEKPFDTKVDLRSLTIDQCQRLAPLLKKWYEDVIKNRAIKDLILIELTVFRH